MDRMTEFNLTGPWILGRDQGFLMLRRIGVHYERAATLIGIATIVVLLEQWLHGS